MKNKIFFVLLIISFIMTIAIIISYELNTYHHTKELLTSLNYCTENCNILQNIYNNQIDLNNNFFVFFHNITFNYLKIVSVLLFLLLNIFAINNICNCLCNKNFSYNYIRENNKDFLKRIILNNYKYALIFPLSIIIVIIYGFITKDFSITLDISYYAWNSTILNNPLLFVIFYILQIILFSLFYINFGMIVARKVKKFIPTILASYTLFIGIELILEFSQNFISQIFNFKWVNYLNMWDVISFDDRAGIMAPLIFPTLLFIISFIIVIRLYSNKEKLLIDCETKN